MTLGRIFFDLIVSGVATAGFALLFRTETRSLLPGALIGGVGYIVYDALALSSGSTVLAAFFACLLIGAISELAARLLKGPTIVFATMGVIPIVPGYGLTRPWNTWCSRITAAPLPSAWRPCSSPAPSP